MGRDPLTPDCAIRDCTRAAGRSSLCAEHHRLVPREWSVALAAEVMHVSHTIAKERHAEWADYAQSRVDSGDTEPRPKVEPHFMQARGREHAASKRS